MKYDEAQKVISELKGWLYPKIIEEVDLCDEGPYYVTAIDPIDYKRKVYNPHTGFFEDI